MIQTEHITINDLPLTRNYSDGGYYIQRNGVQYAEAIDPADSGRTYTETDVPIEGAATTETEEKAAAYDILTGVAE